MKNLIKLVGFLGLSISLSYSAKTLGPCESYDITPFCGGILTIITLWKGERKLDVRIQAERVISFVEQVNG